MIRKMKKVLSEIIEFVVGCLIAAAYIGLCIYLSSVLCYYFLNIDMNAPKTPEGEGSELIVVVIAIVIFFIPIAIGEAFED